MAGMHPWEVGVPWKQIEMWRECPFFRVAKLDNGSVTAVASGQGGAEAMVVMLPDRPSVNLPL